MWLNMHLLFYWNLQLTSWQNKLKWNAGHYRQSHIYGAKSVGRFPVFCVGRLFTSSMMPSTWLATLIALSSMVLSSSWGVVTIEVSSALKQFIHSACSVTLFSLVCLISINMDDWILETYLLPIIALRTWFINCFVTDASEPSITVNIPAIAPNCLIKLLLAAATSVVSTTILNLISSAVGGLSPCLRNFKPIEERDDE